MKVFIFGASGMLGSYLTKYLQDYFEIVAITRKEIDLTDDFSLITKKYKFNKSDVIINAAGIIKQRNYSLDELVKVNSLFPKFLSTLNCNVIHVTTDCVFSGKDGSYNEDSYHDCLDDYGKSKSLGECENLTIIRTSIIGEEILNKKSLIEWVKSNTNTTINGYLNHFWNGVTCLELSKHILSIIKNKSYWKGVRHYFSPDTVSKYQLVSYVNEIYDLGNKVNPVMSEYCDRSLSTKYNSPVELTIREQLLELKNFSIGLASKNEKDKLKNFPTINYVSVRDSERRRKVLHQTFDSYGINKVMPHIYDRYKYGDNEVICSNEWYPTAGYLGAITSHLKAIKEWYNNTNEDYAIFCEDDLSLETVKYWNFTWEEFFDSLPERWQCIQMSLSRQFGTMFKFMQPEVHLRPRCWCDWSCVAYMITRDHAKKLIDSYYKENVFSLIYAGIDKDTRDKNFVTPTVETLIYTVFEDYDSIFTFPLFVENIELETDVWPDHTKDWHKYEHRYLYNCIINWWKNRGKYYTIEDLKEIRQSTINKIDYYEGKDNWSPRIDSNSEKLKNFPSINFIDLYEYEEQKNCLFDELEQYNVKNIIFHKDESNTENLIDGTLVSHLKAIKDWYFSTEEDYALFCQGNLSLETVKYWNFTWEEFFDALPSDWGCIQLSWVREDMFRFSAEGFKLRPRCWCDWSSSVYLISRSHAKKLISNYCRDGEFNLEYVGVDSDVRPEWARYKITENIVFSTVSPVYGIPLFSEKCLRSDEQINTNYSYKTTVNWWKTEGKNLLVSQIIE